MPGREAKVAVSAVRWTRARFLGFAPRLLTRSTKDLLDCSGAQAEVVSMVSDVWEGFGRPEGALLVESVMIGKRRRGLGPPKKHTHRTCAQKHAL